MIKIAKQKIVDVNKEVVAYEVLYRDGNHELGVDDNDKITLDVIVASFLQVGYSNMVQNKEKLAFNFTNGNLLKNIADTVLPENVILEILETVEFDSDLTVTLKELKEKGFTIALDDFKVDLVEDKNIYKYVDIIKVDFLDSTVEDRANIENLKKEFPHLVLLAEKIEDEEQYLSALNSGYSLFQGYFISKPELIDVSVYN